MTIDFLKHLPLFAELDSQELKAIASSMEQRVYLKNELIFQEGKIAQWLFIVGDGQVKIFKSSADGKEHIIKVMSKYDLIAEVPMLAHGFYPASCAALTDVIMFTIPRNNFTSLIQHYPTIALKIIAIQAQRLLELTAKIDLLSLKTTTQKLAHYLLTNISTTQHGQEVTMEINVNDLANYLGTTRENLSRTFSTFIRKNIINKDANKIKILNLDALKKLQ